MKKRKLLLLPLFMLVLAACGGGTSSQPSVSTDTSTTEPPVTSVAPSEDDSEDLPSISVDETYVEGTLISIVEARKLSEKKVLVEGTITGIFRMSGGSYSIIVQEDEHAVTAVFIAEELASTFAVGDVVSVLGKISAYNGLVQINSVSSTEPVVITKLTKTLPAIVPLVLTEWNQNAMIAAGMDGRWVEIEGLEKVSGSVTAGSNSAIGVKFPSMAAEEKFDLYVSGHIATADAEGLATKINGMGPTDTINFEGPLGRFNNFQLNPINAATVTIVEGEPVEGPIDVTELSFTPTSATLIVGEKTKPVLTAMPNGADVSTLAFTSSAEAVATVDADGEVTAVAVGSAVITATVGTVTATFNVTVLAPGTISIISPNLGSAQDPGVNHADKLGLSATDFYIGALSGQASSAFGLYNDFRLYGHRQSGEGNTLQVFVAPDKHISSLEIVFGASTNSPTALFSLGNATPEDLVTNQLLNVSLSRTELSVNGFTLLNNATGGSSNAQLRILAIRIVVADGAPTSVLAGAPTGF